MDVGVFVELEPVGGAKFTYMGTHTAVYVYNEALLYTSNCLIAIFGKPSNILINECFFTGGI